MSTKLKAGTSTSGAVLDADTTGILELQSGSTPTTAVTVDASQNVGIGLSAASYRLNVKQNSTGEDNGVSVQASGNDGMLRLFHTGSYAGMATSYASTGSYVPLVFTIGSERMRIDSSGNALIGTSSQSGTEKLGVSQSANSQGLYVIATDSSTYANSVALLRGSRNTTNATWNFLRCFNNGDKLYIYDSGNVVNANNSYGAISDAKLKENIVDATSKLEDLCKVKVRQYNLIGDDKKQIGVVAQELEEVFAGLVDESADKDQDGNDLGTTTKQVKYSVFVPMLIKAIQELNAKVTALEAQLGAK